MTAEETARHFNARRSGHGKWRAKCPVHQSKGLTLAIYSGDVRAMFTCFAGCAEDDILKAAGLAKKDIFYQQRIQTPATRRRSTLLKRLETWERMLGLADLLRASAAKIEQAENEIIWMRLELYPGQMLPRRLRGTTLLDLPPQKEWRI